MGCAESRSVEESSTSSSGRFINQNVDDELRITRDVQQIDDEEENIVPSTPTIPEQRRDLSGPTNLQHSFEKVVLEPHEQARGAQRVEVRR